METIELNQTLLKQRCLTCNQDFLLSDNLKSCPVDGSMLSPVFDDPFIGSTIDGKYEIIDRIAIGAKAKIYKARHLHLDKFVALKVLQVGISLTQSQVARFQKEAQVALALVHPNIVRVYDYGTLPQPYIAMEYVEGKTLSALIKDSGPLAPQRTLPIFLDIANAMCAAHAAGLIHRDLKPSNVIIDSLTGQAKVLDFGLVKDFMDDAHYTKTGDIVGSPSYMSPEQWKGQALDERSDVYSLGCLMYEVLTGTSAFAADNPVECMFKHLEAKAPKLSKARRDLKFPRGFEVIISNCLAKEKSDRYRSMAEVRQDLLAIQSGKGRKLKAHDRFKAIRRVIRSWVALLVLLLFLCVLFLGYQNWSRPQWQKSLQKGIDVQLHRNVQDSMPLLIAAERGAKEAHEPRKSFEYIYTFLGQGYELTGNPEKGRDYLLQALDINQLHQEDVLRSLCHELLSDTYYELEDYKEALKHGKIALDIAMRRSTDRARYSRCHLSIGRALSGLDRNVEAVDAFKHARECAVQASGTSNPVSKLLIKVARQMSGWLDNNDRQNVQAVLDVFAEGEDKPELVDIYRRLGDCYHQLHRDRDSCSAYGRALWLSSYPLSHSEDASKILDEFASRLPSDHALEMIDKIARDQHWAPSLTPWVKAKAIEKQRNFDQGLIEFDKILQDKSSSADLLSLAHGFKGSCYASLGRFAPAIDSYEQAIALNKSYTWVHPQLAFCLVYLKRYDESTREWDEALRVEPNNHSIYLYRGCTFFAANKFKQAAEDLNDYLKLENWHSENCSEVAALLYLAHRFDHAGQAATEILALSEKRLPETTAWPYPLFSYITRRITAAQLLKCAGKDTSTRTDAFTFLGLDYLLNGKTAEAKKCLHWAAEQGSINSLEQVLAAASLDAINKAPGSNSWTH